MLEDGLRPDTICGVSSGAIIGTMLAQGLVRGGHSGARADMRLFWRTMAQAHSVSPLQSGPVERWLWGWDMSNSVLWQGLEMTMRMFSPAQLNPFGHNPLWYFLHDLVDPHLLCDPGAPKLFVSATDVETGKAVIFENAAIDADVLCASACLPFVFPAVQIGERSYWDGGYSGNPPLTPLLQPVAPRHLILIRAQPHVRSGIPSTPTEITNRLNEIACQNVLEAELATLPAGVRWHDQLRTRTRRWRICRFRLNSMRERKRFLNTLFDAGRNAIGKVTRSVWQPAMGRGDGTFLWLSRLFGCSDIKRPVAGSGWVKRRIQ